MLLFITGDRYMKYMTSDEIRDTWLRFFQEKGHYIEPSASLVPVNDPTLLWINAGVAALKKYFDGSETPKHRRITNAQKCIRTNDIDNVGHTARHHTFFEMMGNFSIGDYFRHEVIPWAFELLTSDEYYGLDKNKLYVTYYPDDLDTYECWVKAGIPKENMVACYHNFWEIGEGPCGPDTEINYDRGEKYDPDHLGIKLIEDDLDNDRYIELWNIVFSQYNAKPGVERKNYKPLPQKNIDTGAGLERFACILQEAETNFDTDLFMPYIRFIETKANKPYCDETKLAYRVIADHIRSIVFALADGAVFSNDGRGYVLKRLLRRAARYAQTLGLETGVLSQLVPVVTATMGHYYPYLADHEARTVKMIDSEERKFSQTLRTGEKILANCLKKEGDTLSGEDAFKLSDTYGFPFELTKEIAADNGKKVDEDRFNELLKQAKELAREARGNRESFQNQNADLMAFEAPSEYTYDDGDIESEVIGLFKDGSKTDVLTEEGEVIFPYTNFYAESGGQVADKGFIRNDGCEAEVIDVTKAPHGQHLLHVRVLYGEIKMGDRFTEAPDFERRMRIRKNHSATHLLQKALQSNISEDIHQEGAYYDDELLRFDFSYDTKLNDDQINAVEREVNEKIFQAINVKIEVLDKEEALKKHAMHLFNEKYGDKVRVVEMGDYSMEFCGGCHVANTSEIGLFVIASESAIAAGIRRITAYTGMRAYEYLKEKQSSLVEVAQLLKLNSDKGVRNKVVSVNEQIDSLHQDIKTLEERVAQSSLAGLESQIRTVEGREVLTARLSNLNHAQEEKICRDIMRNHPDIALLLAVDNGPKIDIAVGRGKNLTYKSGAIIREVCKVLQGSGGGKDDLAFGGVRSLENFEAAKNLFISLVK